MKTKSYLRLTRLLGMLFFVAGVFGLILIVACLLGYFLSDSFSIDYHPDMITFYSYSATNNGINGIVRTEVDYEKIRNTVALIVSIPTFILVSIANFNISALFNDLSQGDTPFTFDKARKLRKIAYLFCLLGVLPVILYPIVYSLVSGDIHITIGFGYDLIIGLILLVVAQVFQYGLSLQEFNEDVRRRKNALNYSTR